MPFKVAACGLSDVGLVREKNEDVWAELPDLHFYVLADGMGGHKAGEVAAEEAVSALCAFVSQSLGGKKKKSLKEVREDLEQAVIDTNAVVFEKGQSDRALRGMGTTLCSLFFHEKGGVFAHVGDSRIYQYRKKRLKQLTKDHSLLCELIDQGQLTDKEAEDFLYKNIITRAVGTEAYVEPSVDSTKVEKNDIFLMCSDGLTDLLKSKEIEGILKAAEDIQQAAKDLVIKAIDQGGHDNVTVVIVKVEKDERKGKDLSR